MLREIISFTVIFLFATFVIKCDLDDNNFQNSGQNATEHKGGFSRTLRGPLDRAKLLRKSFNGNNSQADGDGEPRILRRVKRGWFRRRRRRRRSSSAAKKADKYDAAKVAFKKLHVAWYMQHFKLFAYLNGKTIKRVQYSDKYWWRDWKYAFPTQPTVRLDTKLEEACEKTAELCMKAVQNVSIRSTMYRAFWQQLDKGKLVKKLPKPDAYAMYSSLEPFGRVKEEYVYRATAMYYLCWWTMQEAEYLKHLGKKKQFGCQGWGMKDYRADDRVPWACAEYSFCPDPCCDPGKKMHNKAIKRLPREAWTNDGTSMFARNKHDCRGRKGNPCWAIGTGTCALDRKRNQNLRDLMRNKLNVTCDCSTMIPGFKWYEPAKGCVDINECHEPKEPPKKKYQKPGKKTKKAKKAKKPGSGPCPKDTVCRNNQGAYTCECRKHYKQTGQKKVKTPAMKKAAKMKALQRRKNMMAAKRKNMKKQKKQKKQKKGKNLKKGKKPRKRKRRKRRKRRRGRRRRAIMDSEAENNNTFLLKKINTEAVMAIRRARNKTDGREVRTRVKRGWFRRRRKRRKRKKSGGPPYKAPPPPKPKDIKPAKRGRMAVHKTCKKQKAEDIFKKIMDMMEAGERQARSVVEKKKSRTTEGVAKKIENSMRSVLKYITGNGGKSAAAVLYLSPNLSLVRSFSVLFLLWNLH